MKDIWLTIWLWLGIFHLTLFSQSIDAIIAGKDRWATLIGTGICSAAMLHVYIHKSRRP